MRRSLFYKFCQMVAARGFFTPMGGLELIAEENIPREGPVLIAPVHVSFLDPPAVGCRMKRHISFMAKKELFVGVFGKLISRLGAFPVSRGDNDSAAIRQALQILSDGGMLLVFPEGSRNDGVRMRRIQSGLAMLAKRSGAAVVPVGIEGTRRMLPAGQKRPRRSKVRIRFGEPFTYNSLEAASERERRELFARELERRIAAECQALGWPLKTSVETEAQAMSDSVAPEKPLEDRSEATP